MEHSALTTSARPVEPLAFSLKQALTLIGISRAVFYRLPESERPKSYTVNGLRYISRQALAEWVAQREGRDAA